MKEYIYIAFLMMFCVCHAQIPRNSLIGNIKRKEVKAIDSLRYLSKEPTLFATNDSTAIEAIALDEVLVIGPFKFKSRFERRRYLILKRKTEHVWPYAVMASQRLEELNTRLQQLETKSQKRKYTRIVQNYIEDEFTEQLKKLTKTEGQILVKLMYRQTGETTFSIVKDLKSGWRAFWYNTTASLFNISLKEKYNPEEVEEDYLIEHILRRAFQDGKLEKQAPVIEINFSKCMSKWQ